MKHAIVHLHQGEQGIGGDQQLFVLGVGHTGHVLPGADHHTGAWMDVFLICLE